MAKFLDIFYRLTRIPKHDKNSAEGFCSIIFSNPHHAWIQDCTFTKRNLSILFSSFSPMVRRKLLQKNIVLAPCNDVMSAAISFTDKGNVILLFPELLRTLRSADPSDAFAVLAHEIGHIYLEHSDRKIPTMQAQHEADAFACEQGFHTELENLLGRSSTSESTERLYFVRKVTRDF